jgi:hypothetical protein
MAILSGEQLAELRRELARGVSEVTWNKPQVNAAIQAYEDWFEGQRAAINAAIEGAAPGVFTAPQKKAMGRWFLGQKSGREAV